MAEKNERVLRIGSPRGFSRLNYDNESMGTEFREKWHASGVDNTTAVAFSKRENAQKLNEQNE